MQKPNTTPATANDRRTTSAIVGTGCTGTKNGSDDTSECGGCCSGMTERRPSAPSVDVRCGLSRKRLFATHLRNTHAERLLRFGGGEGERQQRLLLQFVGLRRPGC